MKLTKRISALLLAFVMAFALVPAIWSVEASAIELEDTYEDYDYIIEFDAGRGDPDEDDSGRRSINRSYTLPGAYRRGYTLRYWLIDGEKYYEGERYSFSKGDASYRDDDEELFIVEAEAVWKEGSDDDDDDDHNYSDDYITIRFRPGDADGDSFREKFYYDEDEDCYIITFPECPFEMKGYKFDGWEFEGKTFDEDETIGVRVDSDEDSFSAYASWKKSNITIGDDDDDDKSSSSSSSSKNSSSSSSSSKSSSSSSSSKSSSSSSSSSKSSSSSSSKVESSSSSSSVPESSASESSSSESSSVPEEPQEPEVFTPITLAYNVTGDVPVTGIEFLLNEDLGGNAQLWISPIDAYSAVDDVTADFIASGDVLAAFDLSLLLDGSTYHGPSAGVVTYDLNGTQATASSNYEEYVTAIAHVVDEEEFTGTSYYMAEGKKAYLYDVAGGTRSEVGNITFAENEGIYRPVLSDINGLSEFAYLAKDGTVVEVTLMPDVNAKEASIEVSSLSPFMLVHFEIGEAKSGAAVPVWAWIVIGALVLLIAVFVGLFLYNRSNQNKASSGRASHAAAGRSSGITGLDDDF